ncbi:hypothetical protein HPB50_020278 [Hyalomma asiaticum]|uniref:Uncharacterized protein n=1 Tax=Hyalomma asiaticum TaxID=266040 RepID=A0ACB7RND2_HYAAI|nr:hypothetical protein HPB50_020278 [Hyalomma asiaticum]
MTPTALLSNKVRRDGVGPFDVLPDITWSLQDSEISLEGLDGIRGSSDDDSRRKPLDFST